ncbi:hypothetical protein A2U01_0082980, partial [Trifolium medium]|nr:hypothetical protein [Trifolium medium]
MDFLTVRRWSQRKRANEGQTRRSLAGAKESEQSLMTQGSTGHVHANPVVKERRSLGEQSLAGRAGVSRPVQIA